MRPAGELRQALAAAARKLEAQRMASAHRGATWRDLAAHAGVGYSAAKQTVRNMARAGELKRLPEDARTSYSRRPMALYVPAAPAPAAPQQPTRSEPLDVLLRAWGPATRR